MINKKHLNVDLIVFGSTPSGIFAAVAAARKGLTCIILEPTSHLGGLLTSGLNATDLGSAKTLTGLLHEFYALAGSFYGNEFELRPESKIARKALLQLIKESGVVVYLGIGISQLKKIGQSIQSATLTTGQEVSSKYWIDASYEGDLMPLANVSYTSGRESRDHYKESLAGRGQPVNIHPSKKVLISPYGKDGKLLKFVSAYDNHKTGDGDELLQAFSFRLTLTNDPSNRIRIPHPDKYNPTDFELHRRMCSGTGSIFPKLANGTYRSLFFKLSALTENKFDLNSGGFSSLNPPSLNSGWLGASKAGRESIYEAHKQYTLQYLYFISNDFSIPKPTRDFIAEFGLCADEYPETGGWSPALYVREGRRLIGDKVLTEHEVLNPQANDPDEIGIARYHLDCKNTQWMISEDGSHVVREGMFYRSTSIYSVSYGIMLPKRRECDNLLVTCAVSASHVAFSSLRMEPHWMLLGTAAGCAVAISKLAKTNLHEITAGKIKYNMESISPSAHPAKKEPTQRGNLGIFLKGLTS